METYDPTEDIEKFRDYRLPWVRVECPEMQFHSASVPSHPLEGQRVRALAFDATRKLVLLHIVEGGFPLAVCTGDSPKSGFGDVDSYYENIWFFDSEA